MPDWLSWEFWTKDSESLYHLALILAGVVGIPLLYIRTRAVDWQAKAAEQGQITDRFTKAVEQLGSDKLPVRLGAIYALERISRDSRRDHWTIMETLTAYVREHAPWPPRQTLANPFVELQGSPEMAGESTPADEPGKAAGPESSQVRPATDIQAILTVLGRRDKTARKQDAAAGRFLGLAETDLRGAYLGAFLQEVDPVHLEGADLRKAHLEGADLDEAHLERAALWRAHLEGAYLDEAHLEGAVLQEAHFEGADLREAHLERADLREAHLEGADLRKAHLEDADLRKAYGVYHGAYPGAYLRAQLERFKRFHLRVHPNEGATLSGAHLEGARLEGARLEGAHLKGARLEGAHLDGATLSGAHLEGRERISMAPPSRERTSRAPRT